MNRRRGARSPATTARATGRPGEAGPRARRGARRHEGELRSGAGPSEGLLLGCLMARLGGEVPLRLGCSAFLFRQGRFVVLREEVHGLSVEGRGIVVGACGTLVRHTTPLAVLFGRLVEVARRHAPKT